MPRSTPACAARPPGSPSPASSSPSSTPSCETKNHGSPLDTQDSRSPVGAAIRQRADGFVEKNRAGASAQERICLALLADAAHRTVAAEEGDFVRKRHELHLDRRDEGGVIAADDVGATDGTAEQHVADDGEGLAARDEDDAAGRVPRAVQDVEGKLADRDRVALVEPAVRRNVSRLDHAVLAPALDELIEQELVVPVRALDRHAEPLLELGRAAGVIDMAMGQKNLLGRDAGLLDRGKDAREIAARIDDRGAVARVAPEDRAVLLERRHGDDGGAQRHERRIGWFENGRPALRGFVAKAIPRRTIAPLSPRHPPGAYVPASRRARGTTGAAPPRSGGWSPA